MTLRTWTIALVAGAILVAMGVCHRYTSASANQELDLTGDLAEVYLELAPVDPHSLDHTQLTQALAALQAAPYADPPDIPERPVFTQLYWAFHCARLREQKWRPHLAEFYRRSSPRTMERLRPTTSRELWFQLEHCPGHPQLRSLWMGFHWALRDELDQVLGEGRYRKPFQGMPPLPAEPWFPSTKPSRPRVPAWHYLNAADMREMVTREAACLHSKLGFLKLVPIEKDKGDDWEPVAAELQDWVLEQALRAAEGRLRDLQDGAITWAQFTVWRQEMGDIEYTVLAEYVGQGPDGPVAPAVCQWLLDAGTSSAGVPLDGRSRALFLRDLPRWTATYPELEAVKKRIDQMTAVPPEVPWCQYSGGM